MGGSLNTMRPFPAQMAHESGHAGTCSVAGMRMIPSRVATSGGRSRSPCVWASTWCRPNGSVPAAASSLSPAPHARLRPRFRATHRSQRTRSRVMWTWRRRRPRPSRPWSPAGAPVSGPTTPCRHRPDEAAPHPSVRPSPRRPWRGLVPHIGTHSVRHVNISPTGFIASSVESPSRDAACPTSGIHRGKCTEAAHKLLQ